MKRREASSTVMSGCSGLLGCRLVGRHLPERNPAASALSDSLMKISPIFLALAASITLGHAAENNLFNGNDLSGWKGQPEFWSVKDGAITGQATLEVPAKENTVLIGEGEDGDDLLMFKYKLFDVNDNA